MRVKMNSGTGKEIQNGKLPPILSIPLVVRIKILGHLTRKDHQALRQVCHETKQWIDGSSLPYHAPVTVIADHGWKTFATFLQRRPPHLIESLHIRNKNMDFIRDPAMQTFLENHAASITSLRLDWFFPLKSSEEFEFFEAFVNIRELELARISIPSDSDVICKFPVVFQNLETLKLGSVTAFPQPPEDTFGATLIPFPRQRPMGLYVWALIQHCRNIEFLRYPRTSKYFFQAFIDGRGRGEFGVFCDYVRLRYSENPDGPKLKFCDLQNDNWDPDTKNALPLLKLGSEFGIKFLNLNANLFQYIKIDSLVKMYDLPKDAGSCILSFKYFNCLISQCLPSVERINLSASKVNTMLDYSCIFNGPKTLPNLQEIEIVIDKGFTLPEADIYQRAREFRDVKTLLTHFFYDTEVIYDVEPTEELKHVRVYKNVHTLSITFPDLPSPSEKKAYAEDIPLDWISASLSNVKKLTLSGWNTKQKRTYELFLGNFPMLEALMLDGDLDLDSLESRLRGMKHLRKITLSRNTVLTSEAKIHEFLEKLGFTLSTYLEKSPYHLQEMTWIKAV